ncbi:MAG: hypothetical protein SH820_04860 [Xanthomonadales bacterium]|nr:hypothetical protein [Xanthomonadales bacterium]
MSASKYFQLGGAGLGLMVLFLTMMPSHLMAETPLLGPERLENALRYRLVGPMRAGRATRVSGVTNDPNTYYFAAAAGGIWKTTDAGINWRPIFDDQPVAAIGDFALAPSDQRIIYVGTGDSKPRGNVSHGNGVYRSDDSGQTWRHLGLEATRHIGRVAIHPENPDIVFVSAVGSMFGDNEERGLYRTADGGVSWQQVLFVDSATGAYDITFSPDNPELLYASMWQLRRKPYDLTSGGPGSGIYRSTDGGKNWTLLSGRGLPEGVLGKIGIAVTLANPELVYALIEAEEGGLFRSQDRGESWQMVNPARSLWQRAWFFMDIVADPVEPDTVYVMNIHLQKSVDGGRSFERVNAYHVDHHDLWIDPDDSRRMISGNDGGANISVNGGATWTHSDDNQPTGQFYRVVTDDQFPYYIYGGQQDWETIAIASRGNWNGIGTRDWYPVGGCEMGWAAPDRRIKNFVYAGCTDGGVSRYDPVTQRNTSVDPWPLTNIGQGAVEARFRFQWTSPLVLSPHDPAKLFAAANVVFASIDDGQSWQQISPDLTRNDKSKQQAAGGPITRDNIGTEVYGTVFALAESPLAEGVIWAGSDDGLVHVTQDAGDQWKNVTPGEAMLPLWSKINSVEASFHDTAKAYLAVHRRDLNDYRPWIFKTTDMGQSWQKISDGLPQDVFVRVVREDPVRPGLLFAGTEMGVYVSPDDGSTWQSLQLNLPVTPIYDITIKDNDLVIATHGRGFWVLDQFGSLRQLSTEVTQSKAFMFLPAPAYRIRDDFGTSTRPVGQNPPTGAVIDYWLDGDSASTVTVEILDSAGALVRRFSTAAAAPEDTGTPYSKSTFLTQWDGLNRFVWDLRYPGAVSIPGQVAFWHAPKAPPIGPLALPGQYQLVLNADGIIQRQSLTVLADPRIKVAESDLQAQFDLHFAIRETLSKVALAVNSVQSASKQLDAIQEWAQLSKIPKATNLLADIESLQANLANLELKMTDSRLQGPSDVFHFGTKLDNRLGLLMGTVANSDGAPTLQTFEVYEVLKQEADACLDELEGYVSNQMPQIVESAENAGFRP